MRTNLIIRADASTSIGIGHILRCIALAQAWQDQGGNVTFVSHCDSEILRKRIIEEGFNYISIDKPHPHPDDLQKTLSILSNSSEVTNLTNQTNLTLNVLKRHALCSPTHALWLVLDGYHFTPDYQKAIRESGYRLLVIDDMAHLDHYHADILLNQNIHASNIRYSCEGDTVKLLGCEYALVRREFLKYRVLKREIPDKAKKILVTMGGADPDNVALKVIEALKMLNTLDIEGSIVVGPSNPHREHLKNAMRHVPCPLRCVENAIMPELMAWADIAISTGGSTCWEMAFMGLPNLIITAGDNQVGIAEELGKAETGIDLGWHDNISIKRIAQALKEILKDKTKRRRFSEQGQKLVNSKGKQKVIRAMLVEQLKFRRAQENDCELLWRWANDPKVREASFNSKNISWEDHQVWFSDKQHDSNSIQYIALNKHDGPIGQIRFDIKDSVAKIDYSIDKEFRGMGLGKMLLERGIELFCAQKEKPIVIQGLVKKGNEFSNRSFQDAGFYKFNDKVIDGDELAPPPHTVYQLRFFPTKKAG